MLTGIQGSFFDNRYRPAAKSHPARRQARSLAAAYHSGVLNRHSLSHDNRKTILRSIRPLADRSLSTAWSGSDIPPERNNKTGNLMKEKNKTAAEHHAEKRRWLNAHDE
ncbi:hypothetical protein ACEV6Q_25885, partial [Enterobacter ludwigii]